MAQSAIVRQRNLRYFDERGACVKPSQAAYPIETRTTTSDGQIIGQVEIHYLCENCDLESACRDSLIADRSPLLH